MKKIILLSLLSLAALTACDSKQDKSGSVPANTPSSSGTSKLSDTTFVRTQSASPTTEIVPDAATLALGERVYKSTCSICHQSGLRGAPRMGNVDDWQPRLDQGKELLYKRALVGYRGEKGSMPSRGSNAKLSEAEVKAAVDYIYEYAAPAWSTGK